jgi:tetratricopeptide (TPR) repeat protein
MKTNLIRLAVLALFSIVSLTVYSQTQRRSDESDKTARGSAKNAALRMMKEENPKNEDRKNETRDGEYWFNRGYSLHQSDHYIEAIEAFSQSIGLGYRQATAMYNVACGYALLNDKDNALFWLNRSLGAGFDRADLLRSDSDLDPLRSDSRFKEIVQKASLVKKEDKPGKDKTISRLEDAINNFDRLTRESSQDGEEWYKVGSRFIRLRDFDRAAGALTRAVELLPYRGSNAMYNLACTYSLKGDKALGLEWLEKSINAGFDSPDKLREDPDIAALRGEPRFKQIHELSRVLSLSQFNGQGFDGSQYSKQRWAPAIKTYETFLRENPANGRAWFNLGFALHYSSEHTRAIHAFEQAIQLGYRKPTSMYNVACGYSMMGNRDAAFEWLEKSVDAGFEIEGYIRGDEDLDNLRSDPRFKRFSQMAEAEHKHKVK